MGGSGLYKNKNGRHPDEPLATLITNIMKNLLMQRYCSLRNVASVETTISVKFTLSLQLSFLPLLRRMKNAMLDLHSEEKFPKHVSTVAICDTGSNYKTNVVFINESGPRNLPANR